MKASKRQLGAYLLLALVVGWLTYAALSLGIAVLWMLASGIAFVADLGPAVAAGSFYVCLRVLLLRGFSARSAETRARFWWEALATLLVFWSCSGGTPFNVLPGAAPLWTLAGSLILVFCGNRSITLIMGKVLPHTLSRVNFERILVRVFRGMGYVFFGSVVFIPFFTLLMSSFKLQAELLQNPLDYSIALSWDLATSFKAYTELFTTFHFGRYIFTSAYVSVATVLITLGFAVPGAYAVARLNFPGQALLARSILLIYMVPAIVLVVPLYGIFSLLGLRDSVWGLLIVYPATTLPVAVYMLKGYFLSIPKELEEAGMIDGCSRVQVILRITLPLCLPALAAVGLYVFMIAWNEFLFAFMFLDDPNVFTISRAVVSLNSSEVPRQYLMAGAVMVTIPVLVVFLWFERYLVQGLTAGSVKG